MAFDLAFLYIDGDTLLTGYGIYFILFLLYLELSPKLMNIWLRCDSNNMLKICPGGVLQMLYKPFQNIYFWKPKFWDINYYVGGYLFSQCLDKFNKLCG